MESVIFPSSAALFYLIAAARGANIATHGSQIRKDLPVIIFLTLALVTHALALYSSIFTAHGFNLGLFNSASLVAFCISLSLALIMLWKPIGSLGVVIFPLAALALIAAQVFPNHRVLAEGANIALQLHIALSVIAYSLFAIATLQAVYLAIANYKLKTHRPSLNFLPPLPIMENVLFQVTALAFVLLSISLVLGFITVEDIALQHLAHKIVFSLLAWIVFAVLLLGRWRFHWRGRRAIKYVCAGFTLLALAFFGTKLVLEIILQRV